MWTKFEDKLPEIGRVIVSVYTSGNCIRMRDMTWVEVRVDEHTMALVSDRKHTYPIDDNWKLGFSYVWKYVGDFEITPVDIKGRIIHH